MPPSNTEGITSWSLITGCRMPRRGHGLLWRGTHAGDARRRFHNARASANLKLRVVNVVDLDLDLNLNLNLNLAPSTVKRHGFSTSSSSRQASHVRLSCLAWLIHRLTYRRTNHNNIHVRGYKEEGPITTPFDMTVLNDLGRLHLAMDISDRLSQLATRASTSSSSSRTS